MSTSASLRNVDASKDNSDQESAIEPETRTSLSASFLTPRGVSRSGTQKDKRKSILSFTGSGRTVVPDEPKLFDPEKLSLEEYLRNHLQRYFFLFPLALGQRAQSFFAFADKLRRMSRDGSLVLLSETFV